MSNFEYIISSLPFLTADFRYDEGRGFGSVIGEIKDNLSEKDTEALDFFLSGFNQDTLGADFYEKALKHPVKFIREWFAFDLNLRNAKVRYLNRQLGRPEGQDILSGKGEDYNGDVDLMRFRPGEFEEEMKVDFVLDQQDLLTREKGLDDVCWQKADSLSVLHWFDLTAVLAYVAKLHIVDRWLALDEQTGRELFRKLVKEVRGTFKGVEYNQQQI